MLYRKDKKTALVAVFVMVAMAIQFMLVPQTNASDHIDGPQLANDHAADINDMYFFVDPNDNTKGGNDE